MNVLIFAVGVIVGLLMRVINTKVIDKIDDFLVERQLTVSLKGHKAQFFEPETPKEKYTRAKGIDDLLQ